MTWLELWTVFNFSNHTTPWLFWSRLWAPRSCFTRCVHLPAWITLSWSDLITNFDRACRSCLLNIDISDLTGIQASLPVRDGELGVRSAALLAPSAFLASAASTKDLQSRILQFTVVGGDPWIDVTVQAWHSSDEPDAQIVHMQRSWDSASVSHATRILFDNARDDCDRARLLAVVKPHSGDWLHALPISSCGLLLDDETIRVAVGLLLGIAICSPHACGCGSHVDSFGTHGLLSSWYRPLSSPSSNKRLCVPFPGACWNSIQQGASRALPKWWPAPRRNNYHSMAKGQMHNIYGTSRSLTHLQPHTCASQLSRQVQLLIEWPHSSEKNITTSHLSTCFAPLRSRPWVQSRGRGEISYPLLDT